MGKRIKNYWGRMPALFLALLMVLSAVLSDTGKLKVKAYEAPSGYRFQIIPNEEGTEADIIGDGTNIHEGVEIVDILDPDGGSMDLENGSYHVTQNEVFSFQVFFRTPTGEHSENIDVAVDSLTEPAEAPASPETPASPEIPEAPGDTLEAPEGSPESADTKTVGELKAMKIASNTSTISVPMYTENGLKEMGDYNFAGGEITGIEDQEFDGEPYKFVRAQIQMSEGGVTKAYPIHYYDFIDGVYFYALDQGENSDFDIAYEVPHGAVISFIFDLNTAEHSVTVVNDKESAGFELEYLRGFIQNSDGSVSARYKTEVKVKLTYPPGYYATAPSANITPAGIEFKHSETNVPVPDIRAEEDKDNRTVTYSFTYPNYPVTMTVVGDEERDQLIYGVYERTGDKQQIGEGGNSWLRKTDASGRYQDPDPYYGTNDKDSNEKASIARTGPKKVKVITDAGMIKDVDISTGTFSSGGELIFESYMYRTGGANTVSSPYYFYWPSPTLTLNYFPNGEDFSTYMPISETFTLWEPGWIDTSNTGASQIMREYTAKNGAKIKVRLMRAQYTPPPPGGGRDSYQFRALITVSNIKNSFYLQTQSSSSAQGPHYFDKLTNISTGSNGDALDSYMMRDTKDNSGNPTTGNQTKVGISAGKMFLDKQSIANKNYAAGTGYPGAADTDHFFKFAVTPKWGYTNPKILSFDETGTDPISTQYSVEREKKSLLELGNYSWFNAGAESREEISPFQYVLFMPVANKTGRHSQRAVDITAERISGTVTNNEQYVTTEKPDNLIVKNGVNFDLLEQNKIVFSDSFQAPDDPSGGNGTFVGFKAEIRAVENPLLPADYVRTLYKDTAGKEYFRPGDSIDISDYFRRDTAALLAASDSGPLNDDEKNRLALIMYTSVFEVEIVPVYQQGGILPGEYVTGHINKYLQNISETDLTYNAAPSDTKYVKMISGSNIIFKNFAETYDGQGDAYTYYLNMEHTTSLDRVPADNQEVASVKYDRGLNVSYIDADGSPLTSLTDENSYRTYAGKNSAAINFPDKSQYPAGKVFDHWTVEEMSDTGAWTEKTGLTYKEGDTAVYTFASGQNANNKSIRLRAVWKDISPDSYISIPKNILLTENGTNLNPDKDHAGARVTVAYKSVSGSDKQVNVDVLKNFELTQTNDQNKKLLVSSYDSQGQLLDAPAISEGYARAGVLGTANQSQDIWFNTKSQEGNGVYKGAFQISTDPTDTGQGTLFYISAVQ